MNGQTDAPPQYLLLFRNTDFDRQCPPDVAGEVMERWNAWVERLRADGTMAGGHPLRPEGRVVSKSKGRPISDGPFAEAKEAIGGYILLNVSDMDEAMAVARQCPALDHGMTVEVRPVAPVCGPHERLAQHARHATA